MKMNFNPGKFEVGKEMYMVKPRHPRGICSWIMPRMSNPQMSLFLGKGHCFNGWKGGLVPGGLWFIRRNQNLREKPQKYEKPRIREVQCRECRSASQFMNREYTGSANSETMNVVVRQYIFLVPLTISAWTKFSHPLWTSLAQVNAVRDLTHDKNRITMQ